MSTIWHARRNPLAYILSPLSWVQVWKVLEGSGQLIWFFLHQSYIRHLLYIQIVNSIVRQSMSMRWHCSDELGRDCCQFLSSSGFVVLSVWAAMPTNLLACWLVTVCMWLYRCWFKATVQCHQSWQDMRHPSSSQVCLFICTEMTS